MTSDVPVLQIPERPLNALSGSAFARSIQTLPLSKKREEVIYDEFAKGNIPNFMRGLRPVPLPPANMGGTERTGTIWVTPDYLCVGSDEDFVRLPMAPRTAQRIADLYDAFLPTRRIVNAIHKAATIKLTPVAQPPTREMTSVNYAVMHNAAIQKQLQAKKASLGNLISGHKKDIVICRALEKVKDRVAIYGWIPPTGRPIQDLNVTSHDSNYSDYSHGVRLVASEMLVNEETHSYADVLTTPALAGAVSDEGFLHITRYPQA